MKRCLAAAAIAGTCAVPGAAWVPSAAAHASPDATPAQASVIGGNPASIDEVPWLAFVEGESLEGEYSCTGTVVAPRVVLTAAHCIEDLDVPGINPVVGFKVMTGVANRLAAKPANVSSVTRAAVFPGVDLLTGHGDAGLLILSAPVSAPALPLASPADAGLTGAGTPLTIAGWGLTSFNAATVPAIARTGTILAQDPSYCRRHSRSYEPRYSPVLQLCAVDTPALDTGGCYGDSGGPAIAHRADGTPVEVGIITGGGPECSRRLPNLYTRVDRVSEWAAGWIAAVEGGAPIPQLPKARVPHLTSLTAQSLGLIAVAQDFTIQAPLLVEMRCRHAARARARCRAGWTERGNEYAGTVTVFYAVEDNTVVWGAHYRIRRVSHRCRLRSPHPRACPVHIRTR